MNMRRIGRDVHYQKTGDSACFCNTDLCNGPRRKKVGGRYQYIDIDASVDVDMMVI